MEEHEKTVIGPEKLGANKIIQDGNTMPIGRHQEEQLPAPFNLNLNARADFPPLPDRYDIETFVREQHEFVKAQTRFLGVSNSITTAANGTEFAAALTGYSLAQDRYIRALTRVLEQVRVL